MTTIRAAAPAPRPFLDDPVRVFAAFLAVHAALWTVLPAVLYPNLPLDLIEALTYGREWQLGYDKLPPLPWWLVEIVYRTIGFDFGYYLLAQAAGVIALTLVWLTARPLIGACGALAAVLIVDGLHYIHFTAAKFDHDVIQLPFWALAGYSFHRAQRAGRLAHWALLGVAIGAALWAKYFVVMLAAPMVLFLFLDKDARRHLATPGPYLAAAVGLIIMAPHLWWLVKNDFLPFAYAARRAAPSHGWIGHVWHPVQFVAGQMFFMLPSALIALPLFLKRGEAKAAAFAAGTFDRRIVAVLALGPAAAVLAVTIVTGRGTIAMWGYPLWLFIGVFSVLTAQRALDRPLIVRMATVWAVIFTVFATAFLVSYAVMPRFDHRYRAVFYPGAQLSAELTQRFRAATGQPLRYVIADMFQGGNIAHYSSDRPQPQVLIDGRPERAPWISLDDMKKRGAIVAWDSGDLATLPAHFRQIAPDAEVQPPLLIPFRWGDNTLNVGWAIVRPKP